MKIEGLIKGLHHITATVDDAQEDYTFYVKLLGMRLVKETVNFDNEKVYHFYYGNKAGSPSTIFTTFPYKGQGVRRGIIGTGQAESTTFSIPSQSLDFWEKRLREAGLKPQPLSVMDEDLLSFQDPSGLNIHLIADDKDRRKPLWTSESIGEDQAIRGVHHVQLLLDDIEKGISFLEAFGYKVKTESKQHIRLEAGEGGAGNSLWVRKSHQETRGTNGIGTVHHVAHRVNKLEDSITIKKWAEEELQLKVTEVKDRKYFKSIYFRIPGGVLFEVATSEPGFTVDETIQELGNSLKLPEWQEPDRERIEAHLTPYEK